MDIASRDGGTLTLTQSASSSWNATFLVKLLLEVLFKSQSRLESFYRFTTAHIENTMKSTCHFTLAMCLCLYVFAIWGYAEEVTPLPKAEEETMELPTCSLDEKELEERKNTVLKTIREKATQTERTEEGYVFTLPRTEEHLQLLTSVVLLESECCPSFSFHLSAGAGSGDVAFTISAPTDAQGFLDTLFVAKSE